MAERPPLKLLSNDLAELLRWYEQNLCAVTLLDPRGHEVRFDVGRFAYIIKLLNKEGLKLRKPLKMARKIKSGQMTNKDFGGFDLERAQTLSWMPAVVKRPTYIATNRNLLIPGDELYVKEFDKGGYKFKVLYCKRVSPKLLVPVTSFPRGRIGGLESGILWPKTKKPLISQWFLRPLIVPRSNGESRVRPGETFKRTIIPYAFLVKHEFVSEGKSDVRPCEANPNQRPCNGGTLREPGGSSPARLCDVFR